MGFVLPERLTTIVFDDGDYAGAEATVRLPKNAGLVWRVTGLLDKPSGETAEELRERANEIYSLLVTDIVVEWNVEDHKGPVPLTPEAVAAVDAAFLGELLHLWTRASTETSPPKGKPSTATGAVKRRPSRRR